MIYLLLLFLIITNFLSRLNSNKLLTKEVSYKIWAEKEDIILRKEYINYINPPILLKISNNLVYVLLSIKALSDNSKETS